MTRFLMPYGKSHVEIKVPDKNILAVLKPKFPEPLLDPSKEIAEKLREPTGTDPLRNLVDSDMKVAIVIDDVTRPLPSKLILPYVIKELELGGVRRENIVIIIATGTHRGVSNEEAFYLMGDLAAKYKWINHDCDSKDLVYLGDTSFGNHVYVNKYYVNADFRIVISDITPHYYAGFGGVYKSIVPGIAGRETINFNHSMMFDEKADICNISDNPVFLDLREGAGLVGIDFSLAVVLNSRKEILRVFAGDPDRTFLDGVEYIKSFIMVPIESKADLAISSPGGYPFDINFYQAHKGLYNTEKIVKEGGKIVFIAECPDGFGHSVFADWLGRFSNHIEVMNELKKRFVLGGHKAYYVLKTIASYEVYLYTSLNARDVKELLRMNPIKNIQKTIDDYLSENKDVKVIVMPYSYETVPMLTA